MKKREIDKLSSFKFYSISVPADINGKIQVKIPIPTNVTNPVVYRLTATKKKKKKIKGTTEKNRYIIEIKESGVFAIGNKIDRKKEYEKPSQFFDCTDRDTDIQFHANRGILNADRKFNASEILYKDGMALAAQTEARKLLDSIFNKKNASTNQALQNGEAPDKNEIENQKFTDMLSYMEESSKSIYEAEVERENSLLQQASNMQSAFSFITAGLFVIAQIVFEQIDDSSKLTAAHVFMGFSFITGWLIMSLFFATWAQNRAMRKKAIPSTIQLIQLANNYYESMSDQNKRHIFVIEEYEGMSDELRKINHKRAHFVDISMKLFYAAIVESIVMTVLMALKAGLF